MNSGVVSCKTVGTDCIYSASEGTFSKDNCCNDSKDQNQEKNVRNTSYFSAKCSKACCVCYGNTSAASKNDFCNTSENDLGCNGMELPVSTYKETGIPLKKVGIVLIRTEGGP